MATAVKLVREDSTGFEALSIPSSSLSGDYYLIRNDSIYRMTPKSLDLQIK